MTLPPACFLEHLLPLIGTLLGQHRLRAPPTTRRLLPYPCAAFVFLPHHALFRPARPKSLALLSISRTVILCHVASFRAIEPQTPARSRRGPSYHCRSTTQNTLTFALSGSTLRAVITIAPAGMDVLQMDFSFYLEYLAKVSRSHWAKR